MPVFFIQDAMKFPDLIHAVKPEPHNEIPQAASAHDTFWDFVANTPETLHNVIWMMSPRGVPRSFRMMEGFGIHTFRLINAGGEFQFVKFHWKPLLGVHSLVWDEAQKIAGKDPDFNRRDLWGSIDSGSPAEFELGIQVLDPRDEFRFDFDILDATKLWPEELVPVRRVGRMTLDRNVENFFAETEQVAFCPANVVPGIDFTDDPLLQGRLFSYLDTQLTRLGGPNFHQIPINRPVAAVVNNQRDGMHQMAQQAGRTAYSPNALGGNEPRPAHGHESHFEHFREKLGGEVFRGRSESFNDHFTQPAMFWNSMSAFEKKHIVDAFRFELGKCVNKATHQHLVDLLGHIGTQLAKAVGEGLGVTPAECAPANPNPAASKALSMQDTVKNAMTRKVAILLAPGFDRAQLDAMAQALCAAGARHEVVSAALGPVAASDSSTVEAGQTFATAASVLYDAVYVPGGAHAEALKQAGDAKQFVEEAYGHFKAIGLSGEAACLLPLKKPEAGVVAGDPQQFVAALACGRHYGRAGELVPAEPKVVLRKG